MTNSVLTRYNIASKGLTEIDVKGEYVRADEHLTLLKHWVSNHDNLAARLAVFTQREDLPVDRIPAYRELVRLQEENEALHKNNLRLILSLKRK